MDQSDSDVVAFGLRIHRCLGPTRSKVACKSIDDDHMTWETGGYRTLKDTYTLLYVTLCVCVF